MQRSSMAFLLESASSGDSCLNPPLPRWLPATLPLWCLLSIYRLVPGALLLARDLPPLHSYTCPFTAKRWGNGGFIFLGSKITADGDCSHEIKRHLLLGRKVMTNLNSILKSRDITLPTKVHLVKAMVFLVVMYGCESWTIKKAER